MEVQQAIAFNSFISLTKKKNIVHDIKFEIQDPLLVSQC